MSDLLAAYLLGQLEQRESIQRRRRAIWERYATELRSWAAENDVRLPIVPPHCEQPYHIFYLLLPSVAARQQLIAHLGARGILAVFHYLPLHLSHMGQQFGGRAGDCPVAEEASERLLRLPFFNDLSEAEQGNVLEAIQSFRV
jgi:dTDP-4-amino-4,6-dideoxygalactose transaminase